ncbi:MAG: CHAT domain-containing protein, partial [Calditrichaeota bacterium]
GVKTVLMTLWKVDDQFTAQLMPEFYEYLFKKDATKARALSLAKRNLLKSKKSSNNLYYQHPLFWASFVLYGDPGLSSLVPSYKKIFLVLVVPGIIVILLVVIITRKFYFRQFGKSTN